MTDTVVGRADAQRADAAPAPAPWWPALVVAALFCYLAPRVLTGADTMWMVALGGAVVDRGAVPDGVPFASADSAGWPNVPVLGELLLHAVHGLGPLALALALLVAGSGTLLLLALGATRSGAHPGAAAATVALAAIGMLPVLGVVRAQLLSLLPYALLVLLLRAETRRPSRRIWLVVPLVAVWGNLHGGVLVGVALLGCHLAFSRLRRDPLTAVAVGLASALAVWLNPATVRTGAYYAGVLGNEAARRGSELWARPDLGKTFDLLLVLAALVLALLALRGARMPAWEVVATLGMAVATATAARHGMWLLLLLVGPSAVGLTRLAVGRRPARAAEASPGDASPRPAPTRPGAVPRSVRRARVTRTVVPAAALALAAVSVVTLAGRSTVLAGPTDAVVAIAAAARGGVVLAPEPLAEDLAAGGVTVWMSNPIDAFDRVDQAAYLDVWLGRDGGRRALAAADVVVVTPGSPAHGLATQDGCHEVSRTGSLLVLACDR